MVAATNVTLAPVDGMEATDVQAAVGELKGQAQYAAEAAGAAGGTAQYAADNVGFLDYHLRQIAASVGYTMPDPE